MAATLVVFLASVFRIHAFGYFLLDDYNFISIAMWESHRSLVRYVLDPSTSYFRPLVLLAYRLLWDQFGLDLRPYHAFAWALHAANVLLVYRILAHVLGARYAAACGALFFAYQFCCGIVLWEFGTVFEAACGFFFLSGMLLHLRFGRSLAGMLACSVVFFLALRCKEMAITLPQVWLLSERLPSWSVARPRTWLSSLPARYALPALIQAWFVHKSLSGFRQWGPSDPYYMALSPGTWARQMSWYAHALVRSMPFDETPAVLPVLLLSAAALAAFAWRRRLEGLYFVLFLGLTFLPVAFLVNLRCAFYWYIPLLGAAGLWALVIRGIAARVASGLRPGARATLAVGAFAAMAFGQFHLQSRLGWPERWWADDLGTQYRSFVTGLQGLPAPPPGETLYFRSTPPYFGESTLKSALEVALRRRDLRPLIVATAPEGAAYVLAFEDGRLVRRLAP